MVTMTRYEKTRLLSARALQLAYGAPPLIKPGKEMSAYEMAKEEFAKKVIPLSVVRMLPNGQQLRIEVS